MPDNPHPIPLAQTDREIVAELRGLMERASALPWREEESEHSPFLAIRAPYDGDIDGDGRHIVVGGEEICRFSDNELDIENSELIVAAVNSLPALLARIEAQREALEKCRAQFQFYADEHTASDKPVKVATNQRFADLARNTLAEKET